MHKSLNDTHTNQRIDHYSPLGYGFYFHMEDVYIYVSSRANAKRLRLVRFRINQCKSHVHVEHFQISKALVFPWLALDAGPASQYKTIEP